MFIFIGPKAFCKFVAKLVIINRIDNFWKIVLVYVEPFLAES